MPFGKWKDFDDCVREFIRRGKKEESAKRICGALQTQFGKESFSWIGDIEPHRKNLIRGKALHPIKAIHPKEWPTFRVYLEEELKKAAHTLSGKPLLLDHLYPIDGEVLGARYEDGALEYFAELNDERVLEWIKDGTVKHCSVEYDWSSLEKINGVAPKGIEFTGLALLKSFEPGDPASSVEIWNQIIEALREEKPGEKEEPQEFIYYELRGPSAFLKDGFFAAWIDKTNGIEGIYGQLLEDQETSQPMALLFMRANDWDFEQVETWLQNHPQYAKYPEQPSEVAIEGSLTSQDRTHNLAGERKMSENDDEGEREKMRQAQRERAKKYEINPKEGGHLTKPDEFKDISEDQFADPVNYRYPVDAEHVRAALTYFNEPSNRRDYNQEEALKILTKIVTAALNHGIEVSWQPEDPLYRDLPEELRTQLTNYERKLTEKSEDYRKEHKLADEEPGLQIEEPTRGSEKMLSQAEASRVQIKDHQQRPRPSIYAQTSDRISNAQPGELKEAKKGTEALRNKIVSPTGKEKRLEKKVDELGKKLGKAVIDPSAEIEAPEGYIQKEVVVQELRKLAFERIPLHWGYGPYEQNRRIKALIKRMER